MRFEKLVVSHFRNLRSVEIQFNARVNVFFGENAQGKTNLLETIYTLTHGKSFRTSEMENLIQHNEQSCPQEVARVTAKMTQNHLTHHLQMVLSTDHKSFFLNEKKISGNAIAKRFSSVLFSPESLAVIKDSDKERRDLIDDLLMSVFPERAVVIDQFKKALKQRNKLLKDLREGLMDVNDKNLLYLDTLTQNYLKIATHLCLARIEAIQLLGDDLRESLCYILDVENVDIAVEYVISSQKMTELNPQIIYDAMYKRAQELKTAEIKSGHSLVGPHKHDISIIFDGKDSRFYCSQGQQRLIILAFKMAQIRLHYRVHGSYPILLLDDVLSEIDEKKRVKLIEYLEKINAQIFMTTTENTVLNYLSRESLAVYTVEKGVIKSGFIQPLEENAKQEDVSVR